jgi:hypothetical protein
MFSLSHVQNNFGDKEDYRPFKPVKQKGPHHPSGIPLVKHLDWGGAGKLATFLTTFLKRKTVLGAKIWHFITVWGLKKGAGQKAVKTRLYEGKG